jgi:hypothetical protein
MRDQKEVLVIKGAFLAQVYSSNASQIKSRASKMLDVVNSFSLKRRCYKELFNWHCPCKVHIIVYPISPLFPSH